MNDTTRDELIERIAELADQFACGAAGEPVVYALHGPMDFAEEVIEMVTAARDAEIRSELLEAADGYIIAKGQDGEAEAAFATKPWMEQILDHIGLHGDVLIRCTNCNREGTAKAHVGIRGHKMPDGWEQREIIDPITGTELVRKWEATLCPDCAKKEPSHE